MKKTRFTESQIIGTPKQYENGRQVVDICRELGISRASFYIWKKKYGGKEAYQLKELKALQEQNRKLKSMYTNLALDNRILKDIVEKKL